MDCQIRYHSAADPVNRSLLNYALLKSFLVHLPIVLSGFTSIKSNLMSTNGHIIDLKAYRKIIGIVLPLSRYIPFLESIIKESQYVNTIIQVNISSDFWCLAYVGNKKKSTIRITNTGQIHSVFLCLRKKVERILHRCLFSQENETKFC